MVGKNCWARVILGKPGRQRFFFSANSVSADDKVVVWVGGLRV